MKQVYDILNNSINNRRIGEYYCSTINRRVYRARADYQRMREEYVDQFGLESKDYRGLK